MIRLYRVEPYLKNEIPDNLADVEKIITGLLVYAYASDFGWIEVFKNDGSIELWRRDRKKKWEGNSEWPNIPINAASCLFHAVKDASLEFQHFDFLDDDSERRLAFCVRGNLSDAIWECLDTDESLAFRRVVLTIGE